MAETSSESNESENFRVYSKAFGEQSVAMAAPSAMRRLLTSQNWTHESGQLVIKAVEQQLETYQENTQKAIQPRPLTNLFDATAQRIAQLLEEDPSNLDTVTDIDNPIFARAAWSWPSLPYTVICRVRSENQSSEPKPKHDHREKTGEENKDIDSWILQNEEYLRQRLIKGNVNWTFGLVSLENFNDQFAKSMGNEAPREILRTAVDGFTCLNARRESVMRIQPNSKHYTERFHELTNGQLKGLDWSNIFVAGGIALGSLLSVKSPGTAQSTDQWLSSDIDIYIYGLNPLEANKKIEQLWSIFKRNLPDGAPTLVVRNSKTISFMSKYPLRRFQIILKLVRNPAEVLLNFDLDICAMGFDGEKLWMLPRAARALETGYNVFTMDMVQGHYLGTRRASQEQRVFKYANRGYGIRFLKNYVDSLKEIDSRHLLPKEYDRQSWDYDSWTSISPLDMEAKATRARNYTDRVIRAYMKWTNNGQDLQRHYSRSSWNGSLIEPKTNKPIFTHALIDTINQTSLEPQKRSCLTGFELFYRHVALWEEEQAGRIHIQGDVWASTTYDDILWGTSYDELPLYAWDQSFSTSDFHKKIASFNEGETRGFKDGFEVMAGYLPDEEANELAEQWHVRRIISGSTLEEVQQEDIMIPIWMPQDFVDYAQKLMNEVRQDHKEVDIGQVLEVVWSPAEYEGSIPLDLVLFRLSPITTYQQLDRRLDEIYEAIWSLMYSNSLMQIEEEVRIHALITQLSRRALRRKSEDEFKDFAYWVRRDPGDISGERYGPIGQGFWPDAEEYDDYDDEDDEDEDEDGVMDFDPAAQLAAIFRRYM